MVLSFSDSSNTYTRAFISSWVDRQVREPLLRINGVGDVVLFGSSDLAYRLWLDATQLSRFELTIEDVKSNTDTLRPCVCRELLHGELFFV